MAETARPAVPVLGHWLAHPGAFVIANSFGIGFTLIAGLLMPMILGPSEFGLYTIAELVARYLVIADLGLLLLLDRLIPPLVASGDRAAADIITQHVLWARTLLGGTVGITVIIVVISLAFSDHLPVGFASVLLAALAGTLGLIANGPVGAWRASSQYRALTLAAFFCNLGLSLPRVIGAWLGGVSGCFAALSVWAGLCAVILYRYLPLRASALPSLRNGCALAVKALPLFAAFFGWSLYLPENRWVYAMIAGRAELGRFAFGSSMLMLVVATINIASNVYYPKLAGQIGTTPPYTLSARLVRDLTMVCLCGGVCCLGAIVLLPIVVEVAYPRFAEALPAARSLLVSGPPMVLASWLMPVIIAAGKRPWRDACIVYPASLLAVASGIFVGHAAAGMTGAALGSVAGTLVCPTLQLLVLRRSAVMRPSHAATVVLVLAIVTAGLAACVRLIETST
jgi:hypothetical protein